MSLLLRTDTEQSWQSTNNGTITSVDPGPDHDYADAVRLESANPARFGRFRAVPAPEMENYRLNVALRGRNYHLVYVAVRTNQGRRVFKFNPDDRRDSFRFGYRYEGGLGPATRDGEWNEFSVDLQAMANRLEPGIELTRINNMWVRVTGVVDVALCLEPGAPPPPPPSTGEISQADAVRFLNQATFGATPEAMASLAESNDLEGWIAAQWAEPQSETMPYILSLPNQGRRQNRHEIWWRNAVDGTDHLRQRVQFALSEIFVVSDLDYVIGNAQAAVSNYYDMLGRHADGNFRDLMTDVALHPIMGVYLSHLRNQRADPARNIRPDENFAREMMQLFTIGLYELDLDGTERMRDGVPIPTFTLPIIEGFARVFTGWNFNGLESMTSNNIPNDRYWLPMTPVEAFHDDEPKTLLNGVTLPGGQTARQDLDAALDNIFAHANVGPFVAKSLIQRMVTSNPSGDYVRRVATVFNNNGSGVRGDLRAVISAILLDPEARSREAVARRDFGKVKEPMLRLLQVWRAFDVRPSPQAAPNYVVYADHIGVIDNTLGQAPLKANSVFNFFSPQYSPAGSDLVAPEMQILTEANLAATNDMFFSMVLTDNTQSGDARPNPARIDFTEEIALAGDLPALVEHLDTLLFGGTMPSAIATAIQSNLSSIPTDADGRYLRAVEAIFICIGSPAFMVQR